jgi:ABC-type multidrug transport system ATPase subunit
VRRASLLDQMAVVSQEPFLFDGTIRENIRYGRLDATDEEVLAARARPRTSTSSPSGLPDGYDTEVGAAGTRLSGGQRQRVTIARAILRDPAILVLDEATSSLDSKSERLVQDAIEKLLPGRTVFVIAHRLSTVRAAHKIVVLEHGTRLADRHHDELLAQGGLYRELVELQSGVVADTERRSSGSPRRARRRARASRSGSTRAARVARAARPSPRAARIVEQRLPRRRERSGSSSTSVPGLAVDDQLGQRPRRDVTAGIRTPRPRAARGSRRRSPARGT